jgi:hypothetical protein
MLILRSTSKQQEVQSESFFITENYLITSKVKNGQAGRSLSVPVYDYLS